MRTFAGKKLQTQNDMYEQILEDAIFVMLYAVVTVLAALGCVYLLFRRGNAFAADVTPPLRLPQLPHLQRRLQAAHRPKRHGVDERRGERIRAPLRSVLDTSFSSRNLSAEHRTKCPHFFDEMGDF